LASPVHVVPGRLAESDWLEMVSREEGEEACDVIGMLKVFWTRAVMLICRSSQITGLLSEAAGALYHMAGTGNPYTGNILTYVYDHILTQTSTAVAPPSVKRVLHPQTSRPHPPAPELHPPADPDLQRAKPTRKHKEHLTPSAEP
ncbi:hypothetical protein P4O66_019108, partial [Electrophorus voltai]